jgi:hypothetical protein
MSKLAKSLTAAAGNAGGESLYVEDVFSTYLYEGNGATQTISNGINIGQYPIIDLNNEGYAIGVNQTSVYNHTHSNLKAGDFVIVFNIITSTSSPTCTINGTTATILTQLENDAAYGYSYTIYTYQVGAGESSAAISVSYGLGITTSLVVRGPTSVNLEQAMTQQTGSAAFGNNATTGYTLNFVVDREPTANFTASATKEIIDTSYSYFAFDAWSQSGNGTSVPAFTATDSVSDSSAGAFASISFEGDGSDALSSSNGEGGLVWIKSRSDTYGHRLIDTERGVLKVLESYDTTAEATQAGSLTAFNSNGFSVGNAGHTNFSGNSFASWTFRKAEKFFDVVTYTGNGVAGRTVAHNLGSVPGCIIVKKLNAADQWAVQHKSLTATHNLILERTDAATDDDAYWYDIEPTSTEFTVGYDGGTNGNGGSYVAYLFASDAGGFGDDGDESIIKCGSYVGTGSATVPNHVELGFEPQYWLIKNTTLAADWWCIDTMRGAAYSNTARLFPNLSNAEVAAVINVVPTATGFDLYNNNDSHNKSGSTYIYIAIRRPMKTPESGTEVYNAAFRENVSSTNTEFNSGFPVDLAFVRNRSSAITWSWGDRLRGGQQYLYSDTTAAENNAGASAGWFDSNTGYNTGVSYTLDTNRLAWMFKRATGFFDVVAYTGNGTAGRTVAHNLGVVPELMIVKQRPYTSSWTVYNKDIGAANKLVLDSTTALASATSAWNSTAPTATVFTLGSLNDTNENPLAFIAYLFATVAGVSKVGSYTGTGADLNVDCGFTAGARFILIKRTDSTGDWYVWDSARGIVAGNDPYLLLNSSAAEVTSTDYIDPLSSGFTVTSSAPAALNASGGTYIFLAIA